MGNWQDKTTVKKGNFAEEIVHKYIESKGYVVYSPTTEGAHAFDRLAIKNKEKLIIVDIKAKARLNSSPETGIDLKHFQEYKKISELHNVKVYIFFVDEMLGKIYGNFLHVLEKESRISPDHWKKKIILFRLFDMQDICVLTEDQIKFLKENSTRNYGYEK